MLDAQIFIVTCEADLGWLECCLLSIEKFWKSDYRPMVIADSRCSQKMPRGDYKVWFREHSSDGRRDQVVWKMQSDLYATARFIMYLDSDCMLMQLCTLESLIEYKGEHVPNVPIYCKEYDKILADNRISAEVKAVYRGYKRAVSECLDFHRVTREYMQRFPFIFHTDTIMHTRNTIERIAGKSLWDVACQYPSNHFSEFNLLGAFAEKSQWNLYRFVLPTRNDLHPHVAYGPPTVRQFDARSQSVESQREEIEIILGG